jgi:hypothetical protein
MYDMPIGKIQEYWSDHISYDFYDYHTMYSAIQIAAYLGFAEIYLVGCDLGLSYKNPHMICESGLDPHRFNGTKAEYIKEATKQNTTLPSIINGLALKFINSTAVASESIDNIIQMLISNSKEVDHFTPDYYNRTEIVDGETHEQEIIKSHIMAKRICESKGITIRNATIGGQLEVYDRTNISELL